MIVNLLFHIGKSRYRVERFLAWPALWRHCPCRRVHIYLGWRVVPMCKRLTYAAGGRDADQKGCGGKLECFF